MRTRFFFYNNIYKGQTITSKKLPKENEIIQIVKPKTKHPSTLISAIYTYGEVLYIMANISNKTFKTCEKINT